MADFRLEMSFQGIGPHANSVFDERMKSINMAIYANNGSGKSFISKSFKRVTDLNSLDKSNDDKTAELISKSNAMIRFGEKQGNMRMCITADGNTKKELKATFSADKLPIVDDDTGLILHVFNSEYVKENLESVRYKPEDKVSGFILGKVNIDLSKEKEQLKNLVEDKTRKTSARKNVPSSLFLDPAFSKVGLNIKEAKENGYNIIVAKMATEAIPRAKQIGKTDGFIKIVIDKDSEKILGATMICEDSNEIIHLIQLAIDMEVKYTYLRDRVYAHPTMTEALNDVLSPAMIKEI